MTNGTAEEGECREQQRHLEPKMFTSLHRAAASLHLRPLVSPGAALRIRGRAEATRDEFLSVKRSDSNKSSVTISLTEIIKTGHF